MCGIFLQDISMSECAYQPRTFEKVWPIGEVQI
jgi:hypothetical protein